MELKPVAKELGVTRQYTFNRTNMELKLKLLVSMVDLRNLLIAPIWN